MPHPMKNLQNWPSYSRCARLSLGERRGKVPAARRACVRTEAIVAAHSATLGSSTQSSRRESLKWRPRTLRSGPLGGLGALLLFPVGASFEVVLVLFVAVIALLLSLPERLPRVRAPAARRLVAWAHLRRLRGAHRGHRRARRAGDPRGHEVVVRVERRALVRRRVVDVEERAEDARGRGSADE